MDLATLGYIAGVYLAIGIIIYGYEDIIRDKNIYDYILQIVDKSLYLFART